MVDTNSEKLFQRAVNLIPGGVNSPVRACKSVNKNPLFIQRGSGPRIFDADGNAYIDYVGSWGPLILGHADSTVTASIVDVLRRGTTFGAPCDLEIELAELVKEFVPSVEMVRMVSSGTEAAMSAVRLARGFTGRDIIIKFDGCYHGHSDVLLVGAGSGVATLNIPGSPGIPLDVTKNTISIPFNDIEKFNEIMDLYGDKTACVIVEPVAGNMGCILPKPGFLEALRDKTKEYGSVLIFDEVMTGFRVSKNSAQGYFNIKPDLSCFGKIIGGGMPVGAFGGKKEIMECLAPSGNVYQAGTLSGNPVAMAAGIATLKQLKEPSFYDKLSQKTEQLVLGIKNAAKETGIKIYASHLGGMFGFFFTDIEVYNYEDAKTSDLDLFAQYYSKMLSRGIYLAPSQFEAGFVSSVHTEADINATVNAALSVFKTLTKN
ncbi:MAG: glutamate-1-semialdehyde 2,1-aminomutase [Desulforegulaceae bacterium]|nr:glutamate-1-semialdehyde 2,1-aminomutase [Desulforegulaceae bacterium]